MKSGRIEDMRGVILPEKRFKLILSVYLIFEKDGKILLLKRQNTGYEDGNYGLVAGHADGGESARDAAVREGLEESGVTLNPDKLIPVHFMHRRQEDERFDVFFKVPEWEGNPVNTEPEKCSELAWFAWEKLPTNTIPYIIQALEYVRDDKHYSQFGW